MDVLEEMTTLTLGVLGRTLLDAELSGFHGVGGVLRGRTGPGHVRAGDVERRAALDPAAPAAAVPACPAALQQVVDELVAGRGRAVDGRDDVLSRLIVSTRLENDPRVARQRLRDELVTLLLAGHETTASTLGWSLHLLDRHPEVRQRVREEAVTVLGDRLPGTRTCTGCGTRRWWWRR